MNLISDFQHPEGSTFVGWICSGNIIKKDFQYEIYALLLKSKQKVLIVELKKDRNNAFIFNADGSLHHQVINPDSNALCFGDCYYVNDELTLISRRQDGSMKAVVVSENGDILKCYETR